MPGFADEPPGQSFQWPAFKGGSQGIAQSQTQQTALEMIEFHDRSLRVVFGSMFQSESMDGFVTNSIDIQKIAIFAFRHVNSNSEWVDAMMFQDF
jgi:hypothetical protein